MSSAERSSRQLVHLALVLSALTEAAVTGRSAAGIHGGWTIAARHAGVVIGLLILTPIFTAQLETNRVDALDSSTAILLDSDIPPVEKLQLGSSLASQIDLQGNQVPDVAAAFEPLPTDPVERDEYEDVLTRIEEQLDRAATHAFSSSFLISALFGLLALIPIGLTRRLDL